MRILFGKGILFKATKLTEVVPLLFCIFFTSGRFLYFVCIEVNSVNFLFIPIH